VKLEKAIEILTIFRNQFHPDTDFDYAQAVSLGIEALKRLEQNRYYAPPQFPRLLPGETEE